jgi:hypothetical protein
MSKWQQNVTTFRMVVSLLALSTCGCQGGLTGAPSLGNLNNPTRVPPPSTGSFQIPPNYAAPAATGAATGRSTTLGMLRSLETGKPVVDKIGLDGFAATEVTEGAFTSSPVIQAAALNELPDPRLNEATRASISSDEGIKWKSPQR